MDKVEFYEEMMNHGFIFSKIGNSILVKKIKTNKNQSENICDNTAPVTSMMFDNKHNAENFIKDIIGWKEEIHPDHLIPMSEVKKIIQEKDDEMHAGYQQALEIIKDLKDKLAVKSQQDITEQSHQDVATTAVNDFIEKEFEAYMLYDIGFGVTSQSLGIIKHYYPGNAQEIAEKRALQFFEEIYPKENYENINKQIKIRLKY